MLDLHILSRALTNLLKSFNSELLGTYIYELAAIQK